MQASAFEAGVVDEKIRALLRRLLDADSIDSFCPLSRQFLFQEILQNLKSDFFFSINNTFPAFGNKHPDLSGKET